MKDDAQWKIHIKRLVDNDPTLVTLDLSHWQICAEDVESLNNSMQSDNSILRELNLCNNPLGNRGVQLLCRISLRSQNLSSLYLHKNDLTTDAVNDLAQLVLHHPSLETLSLGDNALCDSGIKILCAALLQKKTSFSLYLGNCKMSAVGVKYLSDCLQANPTLHTLAIGTPLLEGECVDDEGAKYLGQALTKNTHLARLYLCGHPLTDIGVLDLIQGICHNTTLTHLDLSDPAVPFGMSLANRVADILTHQYSLVRIDGLAQSQLSRVLTRNRKLASDFLSAVKQDDLNKLNASLESGTSLWVSDTLEAASDTLHGYTALHHAAAKGHLKIAHALVNRGLSPYLNYTAKLTPLAVAVQANQSVIINYFNTGSMPIAESPENMRRHFQLFTVAKEYTLPPARQCFLAALRECSTFLRGTKSIKAFISYAWEQDSAENSQLQARLQMLKDDLTLLGVEVMLDIRNLETDILGFMSNGIERSDVIFLIGTPQLAKRLAATATKPNNAQIEYAHIKEKHHKNPSCLIPLLFKGNYNLSFPAEIMNIMIRDCRTAGDDEWAGVDFYHNYFRSLTSLVSPYGIIPILFSLNQERQLMQRYQFAIQHLETRLENMALAYVQQPLNLTPSMSHP